MIKKYLEKDENIIAKIICFILLVFVYNFCMGCSNQIEKNTENDKIGNKYSITDSTGTVINFEKKPEKIVSLSISTDEILIDLVDSKRITAVTYLADDPEISNIVDRVKSIPNRAYGNSAEALLAMHPDIIIAADFFKQEMIQSLRDLGLKVYVYKTPNNMEEIKKAINDIAVLVGEQANAEKLIRQMDNKLKSVKNKVGSIKPSEQKRVVFIRSNGVFYRPESSFMDICRYANVKDATEDLHYTQSGILSQEEVVRLNPDAFVIPVWNYDGKHDQVQMKAEILSNPSYQTTKAGKNKNVIMLPAAHVLAVSQYTVNAVEDMAYKIAYLDQKFGRNTRFLGYFFNQVILGKDHDRFVESYSKKFFNAGIDQVEVDVRYSKPVTQKAASCRKLIVEYNKNSNVAKDIIKLAVDGIGIISDEKLKILEDNIENKRFGLRPVLENNPISTDQELEEE